MLHLLPAHALSCPFLSRRFLSSANCYSAEAVLTQVPVASSEPNGRGRVVRVEWTVDFCAFQLIYFRLF